MREINNMEDLRMAQMEVEHQIALKEMELGAHMQSVKELLNPMTYINYAVSKMAAVEQLAASFYKGYTTIKELIAQYRNKKREQHNNKETDTDIIPDNNQ